LTGNNDRGANVIRRAIISVHDKSGLADLARSLAELGVQILSTGGTADTIRAGGIEVQDVSELTGFRELLGGRVKSMHPAVHAGILTRRDVHGDLEELNEHGIEMIDLVVANFYPFDSRQPDSGVAKATELIDIGGPALVRAAAKNHAFVTVATDPEDYAELLAEMTVGGGSTSLEFRKRLAARAFSLTAAYDAEIATWLHGLVSENDPERILINGRNGCSLPYGENPHQRATFHAVGPSGHGLGSARQIGGKPLGYNNLLDANAAAALASEFDEGRLAACALVKHGTPCGVAVAHSPSEAFEKAWNCDPVSAFGGVVAMNRPLDANTAERIAGRFVEVLIAPSVDEDAVRVLKAKPRLRILECGVPDFAGDNREVRSVCGGLLVQDPDRSRFDREECRVVTVMGPTEEQWDDLEFAWNVAKHAKSNAIVLAANGAAVGIGSGQTSRVAAAGMASANHHNHHANARNVVAASDGFFPFPDGIEKLATAGVAAIIQPGGSRNDSEIIKAANELGLAMVFTGIRNFRH